MNYVKEINSFYDWLETNSVSDSAITLWHALMHINNKASSSAEWIEEFTVAISTLMVKTSLSKSSIIRARNQLKQLRRIDFRERKGNQSSVYSLVAFHTDTKSVTETDTQCVTQYGTQTDTINRLNKTETKLNNKEKIIIKESDVELVYQAYPSKCIIRGASTSKGAKNKTTIRSIIKTIPAERLVEKIKKYVEDCRRHSVYMKNFSTFLNNVPDDDSSLSIGENIPQLGVGEYIENGKRYYGSQKYEVPMDMPPRPTERHYLNISLKQWNV